MCVINVIHYYNSYVLLHRVFFYCTLRNSKHSYHHCILVCTFFTSSSLIYQVHPYKQHLSPMYTLPYMWTYFNACLSDCNVLYVFMLLLHYVVNERTLERSRFHASYTCASHVTLRYLPKYAQQQLLPSIYKLKIKFQYGIYKDNITLHLTLYIHIFFYKLVIYAYILWFSLSWSYITIEQ